MRPDTPPDDKGIYTGWIPLFFKWQWLEIGFKQYRIFVVGPEKARDPNARDKYLDKLLVEWGDICSECGRKILSKHSVDLGHNMAHSHGGPCQLWNLRPSHATCNLKRRNRTDYDAVRRECEAIPYDELDNRPNGECQTCGVALPTGSRAARCPKHKEARVRLQIAMSTRRHRAADGGAGSRASNRRYLDKDGAADQQRARARYAAECADAFYFWLRDTKRLTGPYTNRDKAKKGGFTTSVVLAHPGEGEVGRSGVWVDQTGLKLYIEFITAHPDRKDWLTRDLGVRHWRAENDLPIQGRETKLAPRPAPSQKNGAVKSAVKRCLDAGVTDASKILEAIEAEGLQTTLDSVASIKCKLRKKR